MPNFDKEKLSELSELFVKAEQLIKRSEQFSDGVVIPSINELRYFGYHLLQAILDDQDQTKINDQLIKAESHAKRAIYDASESIVLFHLMKAEDFQERFSSSIFVTDVLPNYIELRQQLQNAKDQIDQLRQNQSAYKNRDQYYDQCLPHMEVLINIVQQFEIAKPEIIKKDNYKADQDLQAARRHDITIGLTLLGSVIALVIGAVQIFA